MHSCSHSCFRSEVYAIKESLLVLVALLLARIGRASAQTQTSYTYVDLGIVRVTSINNAGQITGGSPSFLITPLDTNGDGKPDTWWRDTNHDGVNDLMAVLPIPPGHTGSIPHAINSSGEIAGETRGTTGNNQVGQQAFFTGAGAASSEITNSNPSYAGGINDSGVLAGWARTNNGKVYSTTWNKTVTRKGTSWTATSLGAPSGYTSTRSWGPQCINNDGAVAARSESPTIVPLVWLPSALYGYAQGGWKVLPGLIAGAGGDSRTINNLGQLAGYSYGHAVLWALSGGAASIQDLHPANTIFTESWASGLNNAPGGVLSVVGYMFNNATERAFLWRSDTGQANDLNTVTVNPPSGLLLWEAVAINDSGVIIGHSVPPNADYSQQRAFVLIPNP